jgi:hypothetical protein
MSVSINVKDWLSNLELVMQKAAHIFEVSWQNLQHWDFILKNIILKLQQERVFHYRSLIPACSRIPINRYEGCIDGSKAGFLIYNLNSFLNYHESRRSSRFYELDYTKFCPIPRVIGIFGIYF